MKKVIMGAAMVAFLSVGFRTGASDPTEVTIVFTDGTEVTREILSVRDSTIVCVYPVGLSEADIAAGSGLVVAYPFSRIISIGIPGSSYTVVGLFAGMAIGCVAGGAIGAAMPVEQSKDDIFGCGAAGQSASNMTAGAAIGTLGGALLGVVAGGVASTGDRVLLSSGQPDFQFLRNHARYPVAEPEYLKFRLP